jgi:aminopeptidase N
MRTDVPSPVRLVDYRPFPFQIESTELDFDLAPTATRVRARLTIRRTGQPTEPLVLDGEKLRLIALKLDGKPLDPSSYELDAERLTLTSVPDAFVLETEVEIDPASNTSLMGLYVSGGRFCTQCEAEGFRTITFFPDRPDVLSRFKVRIEAAQAFGHLLSNGNRLETGKLPDDRHYAIWEDPFLKPCYLFALVAGELDVLEDHFTTMSGRKVDLKIFVDTGMAQRASYAMDSLKRSMAWDESSFGREYDLDLFMIVAVRDFNFGAMENKGLNIFNSSLLLADPQTATDLDYERIESVVAHEYFHNWTGNRITCRDWFQLCLKEGLTVFRDQEFSADMRGRAVQRIKDVKALRSRQFAEDAGPLSHPVRPSSYLKIDNFYTATIYEKGAEIIRMLKTLLGDAGFRSGMDLYFERHDGEATTVEAFIQCFADASGQNLDGFFSWYEQAGTPQVRVSSASPQPGTTRLTLRQTTRATPGQPTKKALPIPVRIGLLDHQGGPLGPEQLVILDQAETSIDFAVADEAPVISALRNFSAPVNLTVDAPAHHRYVMLAGDPDLFNRWESGQSLARDLMLARADNQPDELGEERFAQALGAALMDPNASEAFKALLLGLPPEPDLALAVSRVDPHALRAGREGLRLRIAVHLGDQLRDMHLGLQDAGVFSASSEAAGRRALRNACLDMLSADPHAINRQTAVLHFEGAGNMTEAMGGLSALVQLGGHDCATALAAFHAKWRDEPLVLDKWFAVQARSPAPTVLDQLQDLTRHPDFSGSNPNRTRALYMTFASFNPTGFHRTDGAGYAFLTDQVLATDPLNPMLAARLVEPLGAWQRYRQDLGQLMRAELQRISATDDVSKNVRELVEKALADQDDS